MTMKSDFTAFALFQRISNPICFLVSFVQDAEIFRGCYYNKNQQIQPIVAIEIKNWVFLNRRILHPSYKVVRKNADFIMSILTRIATIIPRLFIWLDPAPAVAFFITTIRSTRTRAFVIVNCSHARFVTALVILFLADSPSATFSTTAFKDKFKFVNVL